MMSWNDHMVLIQCQIFKIMSGESLKSMKHQQQFLLFLFALTELKIS